MENNTSPLNMGPGQSGTQQKKTQNDNDTNNEQPINKVDSFNITSQDEHFKPNEMENTVDSFNITDQDDIEGQNKVNDISITDDNEIGGENKVNNIEVTPVDDDIELNKLEIEPIEDNKVNEISVSDLDDITPETDEVIKAHITPELEDGLVEAKIKPDEEKDKEKEEEKDKKSQLDNTKVPEVKGHYEEENAGTFHWGIVLTSLCLLCPLGGGLAFLFAPAQAASVGLIPFSKDMKRKVFVVDNVNSDTSKLIGPVSKDKSEIIGKKKANEDKLFGQEDFTKALQKKPIDYIEDSLKYTQDNLKEKYGNDFAKFKKDNIDLINKNNPTNKAELLSQIESANSFDEYIDLIKKKQNESFQQIGIDPNKTFAENGIDTNSLVKIHGDPNNMLSILKAARAFSEAKPLDNNYRNNVNISNSNTKEMGGRS